MPKLLKNPRHEQFVQLIAAGVRPAEAYKRAGFASGGAASCASRLLKDAAVRARLEELRRSISDEAVTRARVDREYVLAGLQENFERAMQHRPVLDDKGQPNGQFVYQAAAANRALELLGKELGMFSDRSKHPLDLRTALERASSEELRSYIEELEAEKAAALGERAEGSDDEFTN